MRTRSKARKELQAAKQNNERSPAATTANSNSKTATVEDSFRTLSSSTLDSGEKLGEDEMEGEDQQEEEEEEGRAMPSPTSTTSITVNSELPPPNGKRGRKSGQRTKPQEQKVVCDTSTRKVEQVNQVKLKYWYQGISQQNQQQVNQTNTNESNTKTIPDQQNSQPQKEGNEQVSKDLIQIVRADTNLDKDKTNINNSNATSSLRVQQPEKQPMNTQRIQCEGNGMISNRLCADDRRQECMDDSQISSEVERNEVCSSEQQQEHSDQSGQQTEVQTDQSKQQTEFIPLSPLVISESKCQHNLDDSKASNEIQQEPVAQPTSQSKEDNPSKQQQCFSQYNATQQQLYQQQQQQQQLINLPNSIAYIGNFYQTAVQRMVHPVFTPTGTQRMVLRPGMQQLGNTFFHNWTPPHVIQLQPTSSSAPTSQSEMKPNATLHATVQTGEGGRGVADPIQHSNQRGNMYQQVTSGVVRQTQEQGDGQQIQTSSSLAPSQPTVLPQIIVSPRYQNDKGVADGSSAQSQRCQQLTINPPNRQYSTPSPIPSVITSRPMSCPSNNIYITPQQPPVVNMDGQVQNPGVQQRPQSVPIQYQMCPQPPSFFYSNKAMFQGQPVQRLVQHHLSAQASSLSYHAQQQQQQSQTQSPLSTPQQTPPNNMTPSMIGSVARPCTIMSPPTLTPPNAVKLTPSTVPSSSTAVPLPGRILPLSPIKPQDPYTVLGTALEKLIKLDKNAIFTSPVDPADAPRYYDIIKQPMCFEWMKERLSKREYKAWKQFRHDFEVLCNNAMVYNKKSSRFYKAAVNLLKEGRKVVSAIEEPVQIGFKSALYQVEYLMSDDEDDVVRQNDSYLSGQVPSSKNSNSTVKSAKDKQESNQKLLQAIMQGKFSDGVLLDDQDTDCESDTEVLMKNAEQFRNFEVGDVGLAIFQEQIINKLTIDQSSQPSEVVRKYSGLTDEWKRYRRSVEHRCQFLQLRMQELDMFEKHYCKKLEEIQESEKLQQQQQVIQYPPQFLKQRQQIKVEDMDIDALLKHPFYSRQAGILNFGQEDFVDRQPLNQQQQYSMQRQQQKPNVVVQVQQQNQQQSDSSEIDDVSYAALAYSAFQLIQDRLPNLVKQLDVVLKANPDIQLKSPNKAAQPQKARNTPASGRERSVSTSKQGKLCNTNNNNTPPNLHRQESSVLQKRKTRDFGIDHMVSIPSHITPQKAVSLTPAAQIHTPKFRKLSNAEREARQALFKRAQETQSSNSQHRKHVNYQFQEQRQHGNPQDLSNDAQLNKLQDDIQCRELNRPSDVQKGESFQSQLFVKSTNDDENSQRQLSYFQQQRDLEISKGQVGIEKEIAIEQLDEYKHLLEVLKKEGECLSENENNEDEEDTSDEAFEARHIPEVEKERKLFQQIASGGGGYRTRASRRDDGKTTSRGGNNRKQNSSQQQWQSQQQQIGDNDQSQQQQQCELDKEGGQQEGDAVDAALVSTGSSVIHLPTYGNCGSNSVGKQRLQTRVKERQKGVKKPCNKKEQVNGVQQGKTKKISRKQRNKGIKSDTDDNGSKRSSKKRKSMNLNGFSEEHFVAKKKSNTLTTDSEKQECDLQRHDQSDCQYSTPIKNGSIEAAPVAAAVISQSAFQVLGVIGVGSNGGVKLKEGTAVVNLSNGQTQSSISLYTVPKNGDSQCKFISQNLSLQPQLKPQQISQQASQIQQQVQQQQQQQQSQQQQTQHKNVSVCGQDADALAQQ